MAETRRRRCFDAGSAAVQGLCDEQHKTTYRHWGKPGPALPAGHFVATVEPRMDRRVLRRSTVAFEIIKVSPHRIEITW
jgi:hypothetical protein